MNCQEIVKRDWRMRIAAVVLVVTLLLSLAGLYVRGLTALPTTEAEENSLAGTVAGNSPALSTLKINKLLFANAADLAGYPRENPNGRVITDLAALPGTPTPQSGVPFQVYKISDSTNAEVLAHLDLTGPDATTNLTWLTTTGVALVKADTALTATTVYTDANGAATVPNLAQGIYLVLEGDSGQVAQSLAVPFVITLPMAYAYQYQTGLNESKNGSILFGTDGNPFYIETVNVYPKNVNENPVIKKSISHLNQNMLSANIEEEFPFYLQLGVPNNLAKYNKFEVTDTVDYRLDFVPNSLTVTVGAQMDATGKPQGGQELSGTIVDALPADLYTGWDAATLKGTGAFWTASTDFYAVLPAEKGSIATIMGRKLQLAFTRQGLAKAVAAAGGVNLAEAAPLLLSFKAKINHFSFSRYDSEGQYIPNSFTLDYSNKFSATGNPYGPNPGETPEERLTSNEVHVYDGGKIFIKTKDAALVDQFSDIGLLGAEFKIYEGSTFEPSKLVRWTAELILRNNVPSYDCFAAPIAVGEPIILKSHGGVDYKVEGGFYIYGLKGAYPEQTLTRKTYSRANANEPWVITEESNVVIPAFDGKYVLEEIKAPSGYVGSDKPIPFIVNNNSAGGHDGPPMLDPELQQVKNIVKPLIPQTGGIGVAIFVVLGALIMVGGLYSMKKGKKTEA